MKMILSGLITAALFAFSSLLFAAPVNINSADAATIAANIKGVGLKKAKAIVTYREKHGAFSRVEDVAKVRGIGLKTIKKNRDDLKLSD